MKKLLVLLTLTGLLSACGIPKQMAKDCGGDMEMACMTIFGTPENNDDLQAQINNLDSRVSQLELTVNQNAVTMAGLQVNVDTLAAQIAALQTQQTVDQTTLVTLNSQLTTALGQLLTLQTQSNTMQSSVTALQAQDTVLEYLDCAVGNVVDGPGFDEVIMRTKSNKLVAYFESGGKRFLTVLSVGSYTTTDQQACNFTVNAQGQMCDGLGCR